MTDREIILAVRQHCHQGIAERRKFPDPLSVFDSMYLVSFLVRTLDEILADCNMRQCGCGRSQVDGSGIARAECWQDIGPYDRPICGGGDE